MKAIQDRLQDTRRERAESALEAGILELFRRLPMLVGFTVQQRGTDLCVADVTVQTWGGRRADGEVHGEIASVLGALVEERPDAAGLLRGRTFARSLH